MVAGVRDWKRMDSGSLERREKKNTQRKAIFEVPINFMNSELPSSPAPFSSPQNEGESDQDPSVLKVWEPIPESPKIPQWKRALVWAESMWKIMAGWGLPGGSRRKTAIARFVRVLVLAGFSFGSNEVPVRAAALTYTTLLSFVPFAIILSSVAGHFGYLDVLGRLLPYIMESFGVNLPLDPILAAVSRAEGIHFRTLGLTGSLALLFTFGLSMSGIEGAVDKVWNVHKVRTPLHRLKVYFPFLLLLIALVALASRFLVAYRDVLDVWLAQQVWPEFLPGSNLILGATSFSLISWIFLFFGYKSFPNTQVRLGSAALGATCAVFMLFVATRLFLLFPSLIVGRNPFLYGSLAALPVILLIVYLFWAILLYGAAVAFIFQTLYVSPRSKALKPGPSDWSKFLNTEREVLEVLSALSRQPRRLAGAVPMVESCGLAEWMGRPEPWLQERLNPLRELRWVDSRRFQGREFLRLRIPPDTADLHALHRFLMRLDPQGTGTIQSPGLLSNIMHELESLYASEGEVPPLTWETALGAAPQ
jgi:YihY family inner membrane protein